MRPHLAFAALVVACQPAVPSAPVDKPASAVDKPALAVDMDDPAACATCHAAVVSEWNESMHSRAHHDNDPIYANMRSLRMKKQGEAISSKCATCHNPRDPKDLTSKAALQGVSCATCHAVEHIDRSKGPGAKALTFSSTHLWGPHDLAEGASPVHGTGPAAKHLTDGTTMCLVCHDATKSPGGAPACTTGPEHGESTDSCTSCHMPRVSGPSGAFSTRDDHASHAFLGPHRAWYQSDPSFLATAVSLTAALDGNTATVTLVNTTAHAFPTGFPGRMAVLVVQGKNAGGDVVYTNIDADPMKDSPDSVFNKVYVNAEGQPVPAAFATELKRDNRLKPGETRAIPYALPDGVQKVEAKLMFRLMPPKLATKLKLQDAPEAAPKLVTKVSVSR